MKKNKVTFWIATGIVSAIMLFSAIGYFTDPEMQEAFTQLGFPDYFRVELGIAKILGAIALLIPGLSYRLKLFTYFGLGIVAFSAIIAHIASNDPISMTMVAAVIFIALIVSYIYYHKLNPAVKA